MQMDVDPHTGELGAHFPAPDVHDGDDVEDLDKMHVDEGPRFLTITQIVSEFLKYMKSTAENYSGQAVTSAVITKPMWFTAAQTESLTQAAEMAGIPLLCLIDEPVAALNASNHLNTVNSDCDRVVAVLDLGATESTMSIVAIRAGMAVLMHSASTYAFSGLTMDVTVQKFFRDEFQKKYKLDVMESRKSRQKLLFACEQIKVTLTKSANAFIAVDSLHEGIDFHSSIHRLRFEGLCDQPFNVLKQFINDTIKDANSPHIDGMLLVGGVSQIPVIQEKLKREYGWTNYLDSDPVEVFAQGAINEARVISQLPQCAEALKNGSLQHSQYAEASYGLIAHKHQEPDAGKPVFVIVSAGQPVPVKQLVEVELEPHNGTCYLTLVRQIESGVTFNKDTMIKSEGHIWIPVDAVRFDKVEQQLMELDVLVSLNADGVVTTKISEKQTGVEFELASK